MLVLGVLLVSSVGAVPPADSSYIDSLLTVGSSDTVLFAPPPDQSAAGEVTNPVDFEEHLYQNPTVALFKSMVLPGWGQFGNHSYIKAGVIVGLQAWLISSAVHYGRQASDARELYDNATTLGTRNVLYYDYDQKRKSRNKYIWYAGIVTFISMFDAYVDAHLSGSPVDERNEKFSLDIGPDESGGINAAFTYRF